MTSVGDAPKAMKALAAFSMIRAASTAAIAGVVSTETSLKSVPKAAMVVGPAFCSVTPPPSTRIPLYTCCSVWVCRPAICGSSWTRTLVNSPACSMRVIRPFDSAMTSGVVAVTVIRREST